MLNKEDIATQLGELAFDLSMCFQTFEPSEFMEAQLIVQKMQELLNKVA